MIDNCGLVSTDHLDADRYTSLQRLERALNQAIVQAEISESYEEYLEIFDAFYADDIVVAGDSLQDPIRGKARVRALLAQLPCTASYNGRNWRSAPIHQTNCDSWRYRRGVQFRLDP